MATETSGKCAHPSCACVAAKDSRFCGTFCEGASDTPDITCGCGHVACMARETLPRTEGVPTIIE